MKNLRVLYIPLVVLLLSACGQVGSITGGEEDRSAPQLIMDKVQPPQGSLHTAPDKIVLPFDEFIELNKPAENIRVTPADVKLNYSIKSKSLILKKEEGEWQPNTTYTIYLNRAVRDITEQNDSIMSYVFSTGAYIDSLQTAVRVIDAYTGETKTGITVGLYEEKLENDTARVIARYLATTDKEGIAKFHYIKDEDFYVYAFEDENRNNRLDASEKRAGYPQIIPLYYGDSTEVIGPLLRLMPPEEKEVKVKTNEITQFFRWDLSFNKEISPEQIEFIEQEPIIVTWSPKMDSLSAFYASEKPSGQVEMVLYQEDETDTIKRKFFFRELPKLSINSNLDSKKLGLVDTLRFTFSEPVQEIDTIQIQLTFLPKGDSVYQTIATEKILDTDLELAVLFEKNYKGKYTLDFAPESVKGVNSALKDSVSFDFSLQEEREVGTLIIEFDSLAPPYGILYVTETRSKKQYEIIFDGEKKEHQLNNLAPGQYSYHFLIDSNKDGRWSTGSIFEETEAEEMVWWKEGSTVRANWEVKTSLTFPSEEKKID